MNIIIARSVNPCKVCGAYTAPSESWPSGDLPFQNLKRPDYCITVEGLGILEMTVGAVVSYLQLGPIIYSTITV